MDPSSIFDGSLPWSHGPDIERPRGTAGVLLQQTVHLRIRGLVQGVGFRDALRTKAEHLRLAGWVRNRTNGEVEALVQGSAAQVAALLDWARRGPPGARVDGLDCGEPPAQYARDYARFERWPSV